MKRIFMSAVALMLVTATVHAQSDTTKGPRREHHMKGGDGGFKQLNLTAEQQAKLKGLRDAFKQKKAAMDTQKLTAAERKEQLQTLHQQQRAQVESILTPAQKEQLAKQRTDRKSRLNEAEKGNRRGTMTHREGRGTYQELDLTTEQQAKLKEIRTDFRTKAETLRNDAALTDAQRKEKLQELHKAQKEDMKTVLTKEQQEKLELLRKERAARHTR